MFNQQHMKDHTLSNVGKERAKQRALHHLETKDMLDFDKRLNYRVTDSLILGVGLTIVLNTCFNLSKTNELKKWQSFLGTVVAGCMAAAVYDSRVSGKKRDVLYIANHELEFELQNEKDEMSEYRRSLESYQRLSTEHINYLKQTDIEKEKAAKNAKEEIATTDLHVLEKDVRTVLGESCKIDIEKQADQIKIIATGNHTLSFKDLSWISSRQSFESDHQTFYPNLTIEQCLIEKVENHISNTIDGLFENGYKHLGVNDNIQISDAVYSAKPEALCEYDFEIELTIGAKEDQSHTCPKPQPPTQPDFMSALSDTTSEPGKTRFDKLFI